MLAIDRILVPVDFSEYAKAAWAQAVDLARVHDARLMLLHVVETPTFPSFYGAGAATLYDEPPDIAARARTALDDWMRTADALAAPPTAHVVDGEPAHGIVTFAEDRAVDLIVIASHGRTGLRRVMLGSVAEKVVRRAPCSVFVVRQAASSAADAPDAPSEQSSAPSSAEAAR